MCDGSFLRPTNRIRTLAWPRSRSIRSLSWANLARETLPGSVPHTGGRSQGGRNQGVFVEPIMFTDVGLLDTDVGPVPL